MRTKYLFLILLFVAVVLQTGCKFVYNNSPEEDSGVTDAATDADPGCDGGDCIQSEPSAYSCRIEIPFEDPICVDYVISDGWTESEAIDACGAEGKFWGGVGMSWSNTNCAEDNFDSDLRCVATSVNERDLPSHYIYWPEWNGDYCDLFFKGVLQVRPGSTWPMYTDPVVVPDPIPAENLDCDANWVPGEDANGRLYQQVSIRFIVPDDYNGPKDPIALRVTLHSSSNLPMEDPAVATGETDQSAWLIPGETVTYTTGFLSRSSETAEEICGEYFYLQLSIYQYKGSLAMEKAEWVFVSPATYQVGGDSIEILDVQLIPNAYSNPCVPDCSNRVCGSDGCGGSCGECPTCGPIYSCRFMEICIDYFAADGWTFELAEDNCLEDIFAGDQNVIWWMDSSCAEDYFNTTWRCKATRGGGSPSGTYYVYDDYLMDEMCEQTFEGEMEDRPGETWPLYPGTDDCYSPCDGGVDSCGDPLPECDGGICSEIEQACIYTNPYFDGVAPSMGDSCRDYPRIVTSIETRVNLESEDTVAQTQQQNCEDGNPIVVELLPHDGALYMVNMCTTFNAIGVCFQESGVIDYIYGADHVDADPAVDCDETPTSGTTIASSCVDNGGMFVCYLD